MDWHEGVYVYAVRAIPQTGHAFGVIDAEIAKKGRLRMEATVDE